MRHAESDRPSGVPKPGGMGESRNELLWIVGAMVVMAVLGLGFWFEASR